MVRGPVIADPVPRLQILVSGTSNGSGTLVISIAIGAAPDHLCPEPVDVGIQAPSPIGRERNRDVGNVRPVVQDGIRAGPAGVVLVLVVDVAHGMPFGIVQVPPCGLAGTPDLTLGRDGLWEG